MHASARTTGNMWRKMLIAQQNRIWAADLSIVTWIECHAARKPITNTRSPLCGICSLHFWFHFFLFGSSIFIFTCRSYGGRRMHSLTQCVREHNARHFLLMKHIRMGRMTMGLLCIKRVFSVSPKFNFWELYNGIIYASIAVPLFWQHVIIYWYYFCGGANACRSTWLSLRKFYFSVSCIPNKKKKTSSRHLMYVTGKCYPQFLVLINFAIALAKQW